VALAGVSSEKKARLRKLTSRLAWTYAGFSLVLLTAAMWTRDYDITFWALLLAVPLLGLVVLTPGQVFSDSSSTPLQGLLFLTVNALWCFIFSWSILRLLLESTFAVLSFTRGARRDS
jgi:hypothetical protein